MNAGNLIVIALATLALIVSVAAVVQARDALRISNRTLRKLRGEFGGDR